LTYLNLEYSSYEYQ